MEDTMPSIVNTTVNTTGNTTVNPVIITDTNELVRWCDRWMRQPSIALDIETTGLDPYIDRIMLVSIADRSTAAVIVWSPEFADILRPLLCEAPVLKIIHNAAFDTKFFYHLYRTHVTPVYCTAVAEQVITAGLHVSSSLKEVSVRRLGLVMDKDIRESFIGKTDMTFTDDQFLYSATDAAVLHAIYDQQQEDIKRFGLQQVIELERALIPIVVEMEYIGVEVDVDMLKRSVPVAEDLLRNAQRNLQRVAITSGFTSFILCDRDTYHAFTPGQTLNLLRHLGIDVSSLSSQELVQWDSEHRDGSFDDESQAFSHPVLQLLHVYKTVQKILGTYYEGLLKRIHPITGRIHPRFLQCGASATGRFSSSDPNFQNLPNRSKVVSVGLGDYDVRSMFVAPAGRVFIISDYSGIELAILAALSNDERLIHEIIAGDIHTTVAMELYGDEIVRVIGSPITKENRKTGVHKEVRDQFKRVSYAISYGSTAYNLYRTLQPALRELGFHPTRNDAEKWVKVWKHSLFPKAGAFLDRCAEQAVTSFMTRSVYGRIRRWNEAQVRQSPTAYHAAAREGMNQPIQSSSADMTKLAMVLVYRHLDPKRARIVASIHDELLVEADRDYADEASRIVQTCMEQAGYHLFPDAPIGLIRAEPKQSPRYDK